LNTPSFDPSVSAAACASLRRDIYVGESSSEAQAVLQRALSRSYRGIPAEALIAGSVDEVAEQFRAFGKIGYTDILMRHLTNDQPKSPGVLGAAGSGTSGAGLSLAALGEQVNRREAADPNALMKGRISNAGAF